MADASGWISWMFHGCAFSVIDMIIYHWCLVFGHGSRQSNGADTRYFDQARENTAKDASLDIDARRISESAAWPRIFWNSESFRIPIKNAQEAKGHSEADQQSKLAVFCHSATAQEGWKAKWGILIQWTGAGMRSLQMRLQQFDRWVRGTLTYLTWKSSLNTV